MRQGSLVCAKNKQQCALQGRLMIQQFGLVRNLTTMHIVNAREIMEQYAHRLGLTRGFPNNGAHERKTAEALCDTPSHGLVVGRTSPKTFPQN